MRNDAEIRRQLQLLDRRLRMIALGQQWKAASVLRMEDCLNSIRAALAWVLEEEELSPLEVTVRRIAFFLQSQPPPPRHIRDGLLTLWPDDRLLEEALQRPPDPRFRLRG